MKTALTCLAAAGALFAAAAHAEDASPLTANISLTTNYKYRGQDQGNNKPALQGGFDYAKDGFYVGNWNSTIGFTDAGIEMDFYGGYKGEIAKDLGYDVGILQYYYPQKNKSLQFNTTEIYGALSWMFITGKISYTVSDDYFGLGEAAQQALGLKSKPKGDGTVYGDISANYEIQKGLTLNGHVGVTRLSSDQRRYYPTFYDYKVGVTYDLGSGFSAAGAVVGATKKDFYGDINKARLILTLTKAM